MYLVKIGNKSRTDGQSVVVVIDFTLFIISIDKS
jgi:hypothetical protein